MAGAAGNTGRTRWVCTGPVKYKGHAALEKDIATLKAALAGKPHVEAFSNEHYKTEEDYLVALADALREEYRAIIDAGLVLQIDDPLLASYYVMHPEADVAACRKWAAGRTRSSGG